MTTMAPSNTLALNRPPDTADVLIVGAGVSGLYCAWRLLNRDPNLKIAIVEKIGRIGGRLDTDRVIILDDAGKPVEVKDEEGGMRFNFGMQELIETAHDLGLDKRIVPFGMGNDNNRYYVRGRAFTVGESKADGNAIWSELYNLDVREQGLSPGDLIDSAYRAILAENRCDAPSDPTPQFWQTFRNTFTYDGIKLNEWGLWSLLMRFGYSQECVTMLSDVVGFAGPFHSSSNAGDALQILLDFPNDPKFHAFDQGFSTLIDALAAKIKGKATTTIGTTVTSLEAGEGGAIRACWASTPGVFPGDGERGTVTAAKVILALPKNAIETLAAASPLLTSDTAQYERFTRNLGGSVGMVLAKMNLYYHNAWWRDGSTNRAPIADGPSFTDLPADSFYVFDPITGESETGPAALTLYCDFNNADFWEELQEIGPKFTSPLQEHYNQQSPQVLFAASQAVVDEMTRQLTDVFATFAIPKPVLTSYRRWGDSEYFGYAYHQWGRGANDIEIIPALAKPYEKIDLYTCGESCSDQQGWVNGALRSAEIVLTQYFGLAPLIPDAANWVNPLDTSGQPEVLAVA
ncbi:MAG TPA: FAD-dependent oxidoreductase [Tahibacter sp.]|nr:FAD-dependent oxidoreductase [Tahibacter sp.]